ncbi:GNAT family N-acetyltransferase [Costertonia aggregata]|uniref:GNAT family N-acetyltransferase n=1 Tax=Costertonia aggregata TaxID=343403 RepID=A0A7H9AS56_9FLAO|nr:GNAT family N-acetyltransferase [Costertonia aggregata]QLG46266.1 GNAT family N-acetyltransferase [Costertonia aggregata]
MKNIIHFEPLTVDNYPTYINVGAKAYNDHYLHLWPNGDSSPYILTSFTQAVLQQEEKDENTILFIIHYGKKPVGILKITLNKPLKNYTAKDSLYIDKIYILKEFTGKGIGKKAIQFLTLRANKLHKTILWLDTMQKGPALKFYLKNGFEIFDKTKIPFENVIEPEKAMYIMVKTI